jgi:hypothetical protein
MATLDDPHPRQDAVDVIAAVVYQRVCIQPIDPYDPEDVGLVAAEATWALIQHGLLAEDRPPIGRVPRGRHAALEAHPPPIE